MKNKGKKILAVFLGLAMLSTVFVVPGGYFVKNVDAATGDAESGDSDFEKYLKYDKFKKDDRRSKYRKYKKAKDKYGFDSSADKFAAKLCYYKIKEMKKIGVPSAVRKLDSCYEDYKDYKNYKKKYRRPYKKYKKYKKYNKEEYDQDGRYDRYDEPSYEAAYKRYRRTQGNNQATLGGGSLGPSISVGLHAMIDEQIEDDSFRIRAFDPDNDDNPDNDDALPFDIKDRNGDLVASVAEGEQARVKYISNNEFVLYHFDGTTEHNSTTTVSRQINFEPQSADEDDIWFEIYHSSYGSSYDKFRDKVRLNYYDPSGSGNDRTWIINILPLEHYVWGMGEITGTGDMDYNRTMTISYRTYGYWKMKYSTAYAAHGFKVNATPGNQIYRGYVWETTYDRIRLAAEDTRGKIVIYDGRIAITPYSSWTDGRTRSFEDRWGSTNYPWCQSVSDPWGEHPTKSTRQLVSDGNHMVGLSAHGALDRADAGWSYTRILEYYYDGIDIYTAY
ncbi:MAG: SpoIID/LytB domain-containing protein [Patescibacteria group bacterium]|nr:SpoIID/LytB domain-containing protein [Patescibacteria group bacterium]